MDQNQPELIITDLKCKYSPATRMRVARRSPGVVSYRGVIYAVGGMGGKKVMMMINIMRIMIMMMMMMMMYIDDEYDKN